jgi:hypothetical protein
MYCSVSAEKLYVEIRSYFWGILSFPVKTSVGFVLLNHNIQQTKCTTLLPDVSYLLDHSYMFRSLMGSSSGIHINVILHKTELAIQTRNKKM